MLKRITMMRWIKYVTAALVAMTMLAALCTASRAGEAPTSEQREQLAEWLNQQADAFHLPGLAAAIYTPDATEIVVLRGEDVTEESAFVIGSCSKTLTAAAVLLAANEAKVSFDATVEELLPGLMIVNQHKPITLRHLLHHRSGFTRVQGFSSLPSAKEIEISKTGLLLSPRYAAGERYEYSNLNYALLGRIIEKLSGKSYGQYVKENIFMPLGMQDSYAGPSPTETQLAQPHQYFFGYAQPVEPHEPAPSSIPAGFVKTSISDLAGFWRCLAAVGIYEEDQVIPAELVVQMFTPPEKEYGYGMGATRGYFEPVGTILGHEGATPTAYACTAWFPDRGYGLILLSNINLYDPLTDPGSEIFQNAIRVLEEGTPKTIRPYKLWIRWGVLGMLGWTVYTLIRKMRRRRSEETRPYSLHGKLLMELALPFAIWWAILWWVQTPLLQALQLEPDLIGALLALTLLGIVGSLIDYARPTRKSVDLPSES